MWAWLSTTASRRRTSSGGSAQFRARRALSPWKRPQSRSTRAPSVSRRCREPVTVPAAPRKDRSNAHQRRRSPRSRTERRAWGAGGPRPGGSRTSPARRPSTPAPRGRGRRAGSPTRATSSRLMRVPGCFGTKSVQQSASGSIEISKVPMASRLGGDLELVHADERPQHRQVGHLVDAGEVVQGLRGHLPHALAGDQRQRARAPRQRLRDAQHEAPVDHHARGPGHRQHDRALDLAEGHEEEARVRTATR